MTYRLKAVGTDTELFLRDVNNRPVPVCGLLGGTKKEPRPIPALGDGFAVQEDNVMVEFNLPAVGRANLKEWTKNCKKMRDYLQFYFEGQGLTLAHEAAMHFEPDQLESKQAQTFGCDPDYSVWEMQPNFIDTGNPELRSLRTAGGHIHISFSAGENDDPPGVAEVTQLVKVLDVFLGVPSVLRDPDMVRRRFYGKAGAFRPKPYGVEYRVLSGFWFANSSLCEWVFLSVHDAFRYLQNHRPAQVENMLENNAQLIQDAINTGDKDAAKKVMAIFGVYTPGEGGGGQPEDEAIIAELNVADQPRYAAGDWADIAAPRIRINRG